MTPVHARSEADWARRLAIVRETYQRPLVYVDAIFGAYCVLIAGTAAVAWARGEGSARNVGVFLAFLVANGVVSLVSRHVAHPLSVEIGRAALGAVVAPVAYLFADMPFGMWWPAFLIMCVGGTILLGLLTGSAVPGRALAGYYVLLYCFSEWLFTPDPDWYAFSVNAGAVAMVGLLFAELVALLGHALVTERQQRLDLEMEKLRSEAALQAEAASSLRAIVEGTAGATGHDFFRSLVEHLAAALDVRHAFIAEVLAGPAGRVRTLAFWSGGGVVPNIEYLLEGTPCERVVGGELCHFRSAVQGLFPRDRDLVALEAESYMGIPLFDSAGGVLGHLAVIHSTPMRDEAQCEAMLRIFAARAGAELERQRADEALRQLNESLEARVEQRTRELSEANVQLARQNDERARLASILETTTDTVGSATLDGRVTYMNRAGRRLLGYRDDEEVPDGLTFASLYSAASLEKLQREALPEAIRNGTWSGEMAIVTRDGREIPVSLVGNVHRSADGQPLSLSAIARDITEQKRVEADLQRAKEAAEAASVAKSTFLATMSHEIRTPMNAVIGMTGLLLNTPLSTRQREFVETIRTSGDALLALINDILDFSKIEAGKLGLEHQRFDLRACVESALDLLAPRAAERGLDLAYALHPGVPAAIVGDVTRLRQILVNLIGNGIKFTEKGEVVVSITARQAPPAAGAPEGSAGPAGRVELWCSVRDTGVGIPRDKMDRLFRSFSQLDASTTREYGGTGLGLAISRRLAELMGGTMWVESDGVPGRGSVFHFTLLAEPATPVAPEVRREAALLGRRVLIVDDNPTNRRILSLQVEQWGMTSSEAASPAEALDRIRAGEPFDVAILDMQMPEMDGVALARAICGERRVSRLPLVMLTSLGRDAGGAEAIPCFAGYLTKPVKASQLFDVLMSAVAGDATALPAPAAPDEPRSPTLADRLPLRILLAEDMAVNRRFALLALEEMGYHADVAANGLEVLDALTRTRYDVILMDVQMPAMDGLEATRAIRSGFASARQPRIIAMTANAMQGDREMCLAAGMDDYISKPIYLERLRAALERSGRAPAFPEPPAVDEAAAPDRGDADDGREPAVDRAVLSKTLRRPGGLEVIDLFLSETAEVLADLGRAVAREDPRAVRAASHRLKGSCGYVGARQAAVLAAQLEQMARADELPAAARDVFASLDAEFGRVRRVLAAHRAGDRPVPTGA